MRATARRRRRATCGCRCATTTARSPDTAMVRVAAAEDADVVATLLHDFNTEFDTPTPGTAVLAARLRRLLDSGATIAVLAGEASGLALITLRPNVWYD